METQSRMDLLRSATRRFCDARASVPLATAAGHEAAIARSVALLAPSRLDRAAQSACPTPTEVAAHVEALAAWSPQVLARVASGWPAPSRRLQDRVWTAAWQTAARHLEPQGRIRRRDLEHDPFVDEVDALWPDPAAEPCSFADLAQHGQALTPVQARRLAGSGLRDEVIHAPSVALADPSLLRLLRGAEDRITEEAFQILLGRLLPWQRTDPLAAAMLAELVRDFAPAALEELRVEVAFALHGRELPAPLVYALMTNWRVP